jgi:hypothetical protein
MIYYHVDRKGALREGQEISLFNLNTKNMFTNDYFSNRVSHAGMVYLSDVGISDIKALFHRFRELEFEYVRRLHYPEKPSRFQSFFCTETLQEAKQWVGFFRDSSDNTRIIKIFSEISGSSHDAYWRDNFYRDNSDKDVLSVYEEHEYAHNYWVGRQSERPRREIVVPLLNNKVTVLERILTS